MCDAGIADILGLTGLGGASVRSVAAGLGVPVANVQYRYRTKSKLLEEGVRVIVSRRVSAILELAAQIPGGGLGRAALAQLMRLVTAGDSDQGRSDNLVLLELLVGGGSEPQLRSLSEPWIAMLEEFWRKASAASGGDEAFGTFLADLHMGLMLHFSATENRAECTLVCNEIIDRCFLEVPVDQLVWFRAFHARSLKAIPSAINQDRPITAAASEILRVAVRVLVTSSPNSLTYRTLAAEAGVSASAVAHHFRNREVLLYAAYRFLHHQIINRTRAEVGTSTKTDPVAALRIASHSQAGALPDFVSYSAFEIFANRHPKFGELARFFRMTRGVYHLRKRDPGFDPYGAEAYDSFAHSFSLLGYMIRTVAIHDPAQALADLGGIQFALDHFRIGKRA